MFLQQKSWVMDIIRELLAYADMIIYSLVKWVLYIIFDLTSLTTSSEVLNGVYSRIYIILGVFMAFKLSFSFFQYIVNPDAMMDKKQGIAKLFQNVVIMLAALILIPTLLFGSNGSGALINRAQNAFLPMLPRLLLGVNTGNDIKANDNTLDKAANDMAVAALGAFFMPSEEIDKECGAGTKDKKPPIKEVGEIVEYAKDTCSGGLSVDLGVVGTVGAKIYYTYSYTYLVAGIVGIILLAALIGIALDVAKRVFKLILLEIIAPIPIMSLIDPDSASKGAFASWLKTLVYTFLDIFIKIGIIYLVIYLIQMIVTKGLFTNFPEFSENPVRVSLLIVALILGLIFFAKEAPKFIKDSLGIKDKGEGGGIMGKALAGLGGFAAGAAGGALHGNVLGGAIEGAHASANAKPGQSAHAFRAGSDKAAQLRTGDDKFKTGFAASMQRHLGSRAGYSNQGLQAIKDNVKGLTTQQSELSEAWQDFLNTGHMTAVKGFDLDTSSKDAYRSSIKDAMADVSNKHTKAEKQQKAYEDAMHRYGMSTNRAPGGISGTAYKATHAVGSAVAAPIRAAGRGVATAAENSTVFGGAARTIAAAHHQRTINEIDRGNRANNMVTGLDGSKISASEDAAIRRNTFDEAGTFQRDVVIPFMDTINPDSEVKHDGHFGKQETRFDMDNRIEHNDNNNNS